MSAESLDNAADGPNSQRGSRGGWLAVSLIGTVAVTLTAVHLPGRVKLIGLFAVGYGLLVGWGTSRLAATFRVRSRGLVVSFALLLAFVGQLGMAFESHRLFSARQRSAQKEQLKDSPMGRLLLRNIDSETPPDDPEQRKHYKAMREVLHPPFSAYLKYRTRAITQYYPSLRDLPEQWPIVLWIVEGLLGTCAASVIAWRKNGVPGERADSVGETAGGR